jgi:hypothetical protein
VKRALLLSGLFLLLPLTGPASGETLPLSGPCDVEALPLDVRLSPDWTGEERHRTSAFLCAMLPVLQEVYGDPYERWSVVLVKDPEARGAWTFSPQAMQVRSDGAWDPQLLTHEIVHAFRGKRVLTRAGDGRVLPELFGFEEGFAEGVADLAMNEYVRRQCLGGDCSAAQVPSRRLWASPLEWSYDFANDASLRTGALWSDGGGTGKARERYQMAAAVVLRLEVAIAGFSRRFNQAYYARLRDGAEPSRETVLGILEDLSPGMDGLSMRQWVARQEVLDGTPPLGKRDWIVDATPLAGVGETGRRLLHFVETFPDGRDAGVAEAAGLLSLSRESGSGAERLFPVLMQTPLSGGFPLEELVLARSPRDCRQGRVPEPLCIDQPESFGLYRLETSWLAPDAQPTSHLLLAGKAPADFDASRHLLLGGVVGSESGHLVITHSSRPGEVRAAVRNGAFYAEVPTCPRKGEECWVEPYAEWSDRLVSVPGSLTFRFTGDDGRSFEERRTIVYGDQGRHRFLLGTH